MRKICLFYSQNKYDYQTWQIRFWRKKRDAQRLMGFFFLDADWLRRQTPITWKPVDSYQQLLSKVEVNSGEYLLSLEEAR